MAMRLFRAYCVPRGIHRNRERWRKNADDGNEEREKGKDRGVGLSAWDDDTCLSLVPPCNPCWLPGSQQARKQPYHDSKQATMGGERARGKRERRGRSEKESVVVGIIPFFLACALVLRDGDATKLLSLVAILAQGPGFDTCCRLSAGQKRKQDTVTTSEKTTKRNKKNTTENVDQREKAWESREKETRRKRDEPLLDQFFLGNGVCLDLICQQFVLGSCSPELRMAAGCVLRGCAAASKDHAGRTKVKYEHHGREEGKGEREMYAVYVREREKERERGRKTRENERERGNERRERIEKKERKKRQERVSERVRE